MNRKKQYGHGYTGLRRCAVICLMLILSGLFGTKALAQASSEEPVAVMEGLKVDILWSDGSLLRIGRDAPITVRVTSTGAEVEGTARVTIPTGNGGCYVLEEVLSVTAGETGQAVLCVPITYDMSTVEVEFRGINGTLYAAKEVNLWADYGNQDIYMAVISSDVGELSAFDRAMLNEYRGTATRLFDFKEDTLPVDADVLKVYDIFLWDDVKREQIADSQLAALNSWVYQGGVLIIGSDSRWNDDVEAMEIKREGWGRGQYVYCGFSLREVSLKYPGENGIRKFLYEAVGEARMTVMEENIDDAYGEYWSAGNMTSGVDADKIPSVWQYGVVLIVYLILLGPVLYYILKKKKRRNLLRGAMVGLALVFTVIIYIMGSKTRFYRPFLNYAAIRELRQGMLVETVYANVSSPSNAAYSLAFAAGYEVSPLNSYESYLGNIQADSSCQLRIRKDPDGSQVWINEGIPFTQKLLRLTGTEDSSYGDGFEGEILLFEDGFEGVLKNGTDQDFENVCILSGGRIAVIGDMSAGSEVDLAGLETRLLYGQDQTDLLKEVAGSHVYVNPGQSKEASRAAWKYWILYDYFNQRLLHEAGEALIMAFPAVENTAYLKSTDVDAQGATLVTETIPLNYSKNGQRYLTMDENRIRVLQGNYTFARNSATESLCVLQYDLGELRADRLLVQWPEDPDESEYMLAFDQPLEFYNWETRTYDLLEQKTKYDRQELQPYLDEENRLTVRFAVESLEEYYYEIFLPDFSVVGRELP